MSDAGAARIHSAKDLVAEGTEPGTVYGPQGRSLSCQTVSRHFQSFLAENDYKWLFSFPDIGALPEADAIRALQDPTGAAGVDIDADALEEIFRLTHGSPIMLRAMSVLEKNA